jgi:U3 small nucleolar ribonucleoprotein protein IMP4
MSSSTKRLQKEFVYKHDLQAKLKATTERKRQLKEILASGSKTVPTELRSLANNVKGKLDLIDDNVKPILDDEYVNIGVSDPKVLITTSRDPSSRLTGFLKEMRLLIPNSQRVNRGSYIMGDLQQMAKANGVTDIIILHEHRGKPDGMIISHLPAGPTAYFTLSDVVLRHDLPEKPPAMSLQHPHLLFDGFSGKIGERVKTVLKAIFPVPKKEATRVASFVNTGNDLIQFRHHIYEDITVKSSQKGEKDVKLTEMGPRFNMRLYRIELGTLDMPDVKVEWALKAFVNKQRRILNTETVTEEKEDAEEGKDKKPPTKKFRK